jgi:hypothetical protein
MLQQRRRRASGGVHGVPAAVPEREALARAPRRDVLLAWTVG